jgi:hypothetical protein
LPVPSLNAIIHNEIFKNKLNVKQNSMLQKDVLYWKSGSYIESSSDGVRAMPRATVGLFLRKPANFFLHNLKTGDSEPNMAAGKTGYKSKNAVT